MKDNEKWNSFPSIFAYSDCSAYARMCFFKYEIDEMRMQLNVVCALPISAAHIKIKYNHLIRDSTFFLVFFFFFIKNYFV